MRSKASLRRPLIARQCETRFTEVVQFQLNLTDRQRRRAPTEVVEHECPTPSVVYVRNPRARRYILRLRPDGTGRVTIPRGGTATAAREFVARQSGWLEQQRARLRASPPRPISWGVGSEFLFRGEAVRIKATGSGDKGGIEFGDQHLCVEDLNTDLRQDIERHLWQLALRELPPRLLEHANIHGLRVRRVSVRNQRTRWGSCSHRGTISLNWRLIQMPHFVCDYICLHELMHLREMNHSPRFWREVRAAYPDYGVAERWLRANASLLR